MAEAYQQAEAMTGGAEIILHLRTVLIGQLRDSLDLKDNFAESIGFVKKSV